MPTNSIVNATTSINYYFEQTVKPAVQAVSSGVCFYYEPNQFLTYPAVALHHYAIGQRAYETMEYCNLFELHVFTNKSNDMLAWEIADTIYNTLGFNTNNVLMYKQIPLYNWANKNAPVAYGCVRLVLPGGQSFSFVDDIDKEVRHYRLDLEAYYK